MDRNNENVQSAGRTGPLEARLYFMMMRWLSLLRDVKET